MSVWRQGPYARDDRYIAAWVEVHDPFRWQRDVRLAAVASELGARTTVSALALRGVAEAQALNIDVFLRELDSWADAENHQPSVLPP